MPRLPAGGVIVNVWGLLSQHDAPPEWEGEMPPTSSHLLRFSTGMLPKHELPPAFREEFARRVWATDAIDHDAGAARIDLAFMPLDAVAVGAVVGTPSAFLRQRHHIKDGNGDLRFNIVETGPLRFTQGGRQCTCDAGWAYFVDHGRPERRVELSSATIRNVAVHAAGLKALVSQPEDPAGGLKQGPALRLLDGYLRSLMALEEAPSPALSQKIGAHLLDLVAAASGPAAGAREMIAGRGLKAQRLRAIMGEISLRFSDMAFNLDSLTASLGLSRSYVQSLLEETGKSFTEHVAERRLQCACVMQTNPGNAHLRIIDVAMECGFGDVSHFNRLFRRRFGDTPSGVRVMGAVDKSQSPGTLPGRRFNQRPPLGSTKSRTGFHHAFSTGIAAKASKKGR